MDHRQSKEDDVMSEGPIIRISKNVVMMELPLYCQEIIKTRNIRSTNSSSSSSSSSNGNRSTTNIRKPRMKRSLSVLTTSIPSGDSALPVTASTDPTNMVWLRRLSYVADFASFLCILDCTILPLMLLLVSFFVNVETNVPPEISSSSASGWWFRLGHVLVLGFVIPVGSLSTAIHFSFHRRIPLALLAMLGLFLLYCSNQSGLFLHLSWYGIPLSGPIHRICNLLGCLFMLTSNYQSRNLRSCYNKRCKQHYTL